MNKTYQFTFTKRRVIGVIAALCLLNFLTFTGGLALGLGLWAPTKTEIALANESSARAAANPVAPAPAVAAPAVSTTAVTPPAVQAPAVTPPALPAATTAPRVVSAAGRPAAPQQAAVKPAPPPQPEQAAPPAETPVDTAAAGKFALQIGSFTDPKNAKQMETELKDRGYAVRIFKAIDPDKRVWHVVRVGAYADVTAASRAAAEFTSREQLQALVRPNDVL